MKKLLAMYICVSALIYGFNAIASVLDMPPHDNSYTHHSLVPESVFDNSSSYQIARTYFMPDYQRNLVGKRVESGGKGKNDKNCGMYGYLSSCPEGQSGTKVSPVAGIVCYKDCKRCSDYNSSYRNSIPDGYKCIQVDAKTVGGLTCYKDCTLKKCTDFDSAYKDTIPDGYKCSEVDTTKVDGLTCYKGCTLKTCTDYNSSYLTSKPSNKACSTATPRTGLTCYYNCKSCSEYNSAYKAAIPTDHKCTQVTASTVGGLTCYKDCTLKGCIDYNSSYKTSIPSGYKCSTVTPRSGLTCYTSCFAKACSDYNSSYKSSVPTDHKCTQVTASTVGGLTCYKDCTLKGCTDYNSAYETSIPADNKCSTVTPRSGLTCYSNCSLKECSDYGYVASIPGGQTCTSVTPRNGLTCYKDCKAQVLTCEDYAKEQGFNVVSGGTYLSVYKDTMVMGNITTESSLNISGKKLVGPAYFDYDKCKSLATPTITIKNQTNDGITLSNGTVANLNLEYDPVLYSEWGFRDGFCTILGYCQNNGDPKSIYEMTKQYFTASNCFSPHDNERELCSVLQSSGCLVGGSYQECLVSGYGCICSTVAQEICHTRYLQSECLNNRHSALAGYGTIKDVKINSQKRDMDVVVYPEKGTMTIEGEVYIYGQENTTPLRIGDNASSTEYPDRSSGKLVVNGLLDINSGRDIYYSGNGQITVNAAGTLKISYGGWGGIFFNFASSSLPMNVYGKLDISSHGAGGKFNNDLEFTWNGKGVLKVYNGSCIKLQNGGGGSDGGSGDFVSESGAQLMMRGVCKKATGSNTTQVKDQTGNTLYGAFTSHPGNFTASCTSCN